MKLQHPLQNESMLEHDVINVKRTSWKALAEKFSVLLLQRGICFPMSQCIRVEYNKGNNRQPQLEVYAKIQVVVVI
jgi:hypothetical protein